MAPALSLPTTSLGAWPTGLCFLHWVHLQMPGRLVPGRLAALSSLSLPPRLLYIPVGEPGLPGWSPPLPAQLSGLRLHLHHIFSTSGFIPFSSPCPTPTLCPTPPSQGHCPSPLTSVLGSGICCCHCFLEDPLGPSDPHLCGAASGMSEAGGIGPGSPSPPEIGTMGLPSGVCAARPADLLVLISLLSPALQPSSV